MLGSGALIVMAEGTDLLAAGTNVLRFFRDESCGKCVPCRVGSMKAHTILSDLVSRARASTTCRGGSRARGDAADDLDLRARPGRPRPGLSVLGMDRGGAAAREHPKDREDTETWRRPRGYAGHLASSSRSGPWPRRSPASGRRGEPGSRRSPSPGARARARGADPRPARPAGLRPRDGRRVRRAGGRHLRGVGGPAGLPRRDRRGPDGPRAQVAVAPGIAVAMPTGGVLPEGADAVVMVEHTQETMPGTIEVVRPVAPGEGLVRADEDARAGAELLPAGRRLRSQDVGLLAAAGATEVRVRARPRVAIVSTGDEVVPPGTEDLRSARSATRRPRRSARSSATPAATPNRAASSPTTATRSPPSSATRSPRATSSSSRPARRSARGTRPPPSSPGWARRGSGRHGIALRPGKPTLLADCGGVPVIGLPGQPALGARRVPGHRDADRPPRRGDDGPAARADGARPPRAQRPVGGRPPRCRAGHGPRRRRLAALRGLGAPDDPHGRGRVHRRPGRRDRPARGQRGRRHPVH